MNTRYAHLIALLVFSVSCADSNTQDSAAPSTTVAPLLVRALAPEAGATSVALDAPVVVSFEGELKAGSQAIIEVNPPVVGETTVVAQNGEVRFVPSVPWQTLTTYKVRLKTDGIKGARGQVAPEEISWSFSTAASQKISETGMYQSDGVRASVEVREGEGGRRTYGMKTTAVLRDDAPKALEFSELPGQPTLRTGHDIFDALFALSVEETRQNSVESISDGAFNQGQGVACSCFETGQKWNYVWTRDTAYAVDLGLDVLDPARSARSLLFKLSGRKADGSDVQIIQDTGTGGSWPVSTDRVVWALGAWSVSHMLGSSEREAFLGKAYPALANTIKADRQVAFDPESGLYRGEQSFLDWREQSYPSWTAQDTVHIGMSRTLSTNVGHWVILDVAAKLATERGDATQAKRYREWADALSAAIVGAFWVEEDQMLSAMKTTELDQGTLRKYDLLGQSLAVLTGVAAGPEAAAMVASYPHVPKGPAVIWPQQPEVPIYHNRGIWPFVTAYGLLAARHVGNGTVFAHDLESLVRGSALNLSNMENFEFTTQAAWFEDGAYSGPVVNSKRQLWSVAGYFGAVVKGLFGLEAAPGRIRFAPFLTASLQQQWFPAGEATLRDLTVWGKSLSVTLKLPALPAKPDDAPYVVASVTLQGDPLPNDGWITENALAALPKDVTLEVTLAPSGVQPALAMTLVTALDDWQALWAPKEPSLTAITRQGPTALALELAGTMEPGTTLHVWRNGQEIATGLMPGTWVDQNATDLEATTYCYAVEARLQASGHRSHHSPPRCHWGEAGDERIETFDAWWFEPVNGGAWSTMHGRPHYQDWGDPSHALALPAWRPRRSGSYAIQLTYGNGAAGFTTGITAGVKRIEVQEAGSDTLLAQGVVVMPQRGEWSRWGDSSFVMVQGIKAGATYRVTITDAWNMSYFAHFEPYNGPAGGGKAPFNRVNVHAIKMLPLKGSPGPMTSRSIALDGQDDLGKFAPEAQFATGAALAPWSKWALNLDGDALTFALASPGFEAPFAPVMLYLGLADTQASQGIEYSGLTPQLGFTPLYAIGARAQSEDATTNEPWSGVWRQEGGRWVRQLRLNPQVHVWVSADRHTLSVRIPRAQLERLGGRVAMAAHMPFAKAGEEWKEAWPQEHTPWLPGGGGWHVVELPARP